MNNSDAETFQRAGFVILKNIAPRSAIEMIRKTFFMLCAKLAPKLLLTGKESFNDPKFVKKFCALKKRRPDITGAIYDTMQSSYSLTTLIQHPIIVKKIAELLKTSKHDLSQYFRCLRIDVPGNNPNALGWHQDFMVTEKAALGASDGITAWIPLHHVDEKRGTLELCIGSHHDRVRDVVVTNRNKKNASEYISIADSYIGGFKRYCVEARAGDVVLMSMNALHRTVESQMPLMRFTAIGRFFRFSSPDFVYGAPKYIASKLSD
ncbi:MAG: phytanoyl-CoA dioxygenase family protein [Patescibacteria group bacterium]